MPHTGDPPGMHVHVADHELRSAGQRMGGRLPVRGPRQAGAACGARRCGGAGARTMTRGSAVSRRGSSSGQRSRCSAAGAVMSGAGLRTPPGSPQPSGAIVPVPRQLRAAVLGCGRLCKIPRAAAAEGPRAPAKALPQLSHRILQGDVLLCNFLLTIELKFARGRMHGIYTKQIRQIV